MKSLRLSLSCLLFLAAGAAFAQPTGGFLSVSPGYPTNHGWVQLPSDPALNFSGKSFTFEAWISTAGVDCRSLAGNGYQSSQWIGICSNTLRSYVTGSGSNWDAGFVPPNNWTHVAVTFDSATRTRRHYVDGELAGERVETEQIDPAINAWRIFSDANYFLTPSGAIDEVRFWSVARTREQIREGINKEIRSGTGLVAVYALDGNANAAVGSLNGTKEGAGGFLTNPVGAGCTTSATELCVGPAGRYSITGTFDAGGVAAQTARVVTGLTTPESGLFWFFGANNWEVMVKLLDGCGINNRKWVFMSATTDQHFELAVTDIQRGVTKRYFNFAGTPAPANIDVEALATCP